MIYNPNDKVVSFDVDDTLVMWEENSNDFQPGPGKIAIPYKSPSYTGGCYTGGFECYYLTPHTKHIQKLKGYKRSGYYVIVWSMGGAAWAKAVVEALDLTEHVDLITSKPVILYDDLPLNEAFGERKYFQTRKNGNETT